MNNNIHGISTRITGLEDRVGELSTFVRANAEHRSRRNPQSDDAGFAGDTEDDPLLFTKKRRVTSLPVRRSERKLRLEVSLQSAH